MTSEMTLREHARAAVRDQIATHAWTLFATQGFEATTVDQIAEAAGMSRRTFFRYFAGKAELVLERLGESGQQIADELQARPADETPWQALRAAFAPTLALQERHPTKSRPLQLMLRDEPVLRSTVEARRRLWTELLAPLTALRLPPRESAAQPDTRAVAITGSALACLEAAQTAWAEHPGSSLATLLDEAMSAVTPLA